MLPHQGQRRRWIATRRATVAVGIAECLQIEARDDRSANRCRMTHEASRKADIGGRLKSAYRTQPGRVSRQSGHLWLAGEHDVVPVAEHTHLRRTPNDAFQIYHGPHA
jgi:hypothetical protein